MKIGDLDQRIELQSLSKTNVSGEITETFTTQATVWAMVISQKGEEAFESARTNAKETIRVKTRYRDDLQITWRVIWMDQAYHLKHIDRSQRRKGELWFTAELIGAE